MKILVIVVGFMIPAFVLISVFVPSLAEVRPWVGLGIAAVFGIFFVVFLLYGRKR